MTVSAYPLEIDALALTRNLPDDLIQAIPVLMVNRQGDSENAYMRTENFLGHVEPDRSYRLTLAGFAEAEGEEPAPLPESVEPPHCILNGTWNEAVDLTIRDANILGGNGRYILPEGEEELVVPVAPATAEHLAYYGSQLLKLGEVTRFVSRDNLPVTITSVGRDYPEGYLLRPEKGGGAYLEVHDRPHFHMPLEEDAGGYLIIGKRDADGVQRVSAFQVPFGYGIHMAPWAIHSDAYLVGRYMVIYSATPEFSTVILRKADGSLAPVAFREETA